MENNGKKPRTSQSVGTSDRPDRKQFVLAALDQFERPLTRYASRMFGSSGSDSLESARDAVQHTFLKLCQHEVEPLKGKVGPWLFSVCRNRVIDQLRIGGRTSEPWPPPEHVTVDPAAGPAEMAESAEFAGRLSCLIRGLSGVEREVIELWSQGFDHGEIASILEKSRESVRVGLHRAIKKLRSHPEVCSWLERATSHSQVGNT